MTAGGKSRCLLKAKARDYRYQIVAHWASIHSQGKQFNGFVKSKGVLCSMILRSNRETFAWTELAMPILPSFGCAHQMDTIRGAAHDLQCILVVSWEEGLHVVDAY